MGAGRGLHKLLMGLSQDTKNGCVSVFCSQCVTQPLTCSKWELSRRVSPVGCHTQVFTATPELMLRAQCVSCVCPVLVLDKLSI